MILKQLYTMKELSSGINLGDTTQQTSSIKTIFGYLFHVYYNNIILFIQII